MQYNFCFSHITMAPPKRKCVFRDEFSQKFNGIKKSRLGENYAYCHLCHYDMNIGNGGQSFIKTHLDSTRHKNALKVIDTTTSMAKFLTTQNAPLDLKTAAAEGAFAYHSVRHHHSFQSADCLNGLLMTLFPDSDIAKKYSSAHTKMEAIICGVLAPTSALELLAALGDQPFSIATDASNHKELKTYPIIIRFFCPDGLKVGLLEFACLEGESSDLVVNFIKDALLKNNLDIANCVAFCADNTNTNFGGANCAGSNNVYAKLKQLQSTLMPVGCAAHIVHNACKHASEQLCIDAEAIIFKIFSHFCGHVLLKCFMHACQHTVVPAGCHSCLSSREFLNYGLL